ncbi:hypothetical protein [Sphingomonas radiodurans]|uniref:hypothetical protein n=1 Tax=Sphingomonas radiodurans TaxID=2890321 RepID=UPI001E3A3EE5|nr:hypothetical protein [Sphingomonas radiodurans]WBH15823.1 hypothetical protein LLW23_13550 [Sphingomonas radiodurans]
MATQDDTPAILLDFSEALRVLMSALGMEGVTRSAFQSRVRQLQRMGLLSREEGRTYERFSYGLLELARMAIAFRMMSAFMLPSVAVRYATERWAEIVPSLIGGLDEADARNRWSGDSARHTPVLAIEGVALSRLGQKAASDSRYDGPLGRVIAHSGETDLIGVLTTTMTEGVVIDTRSFMSRLVGELRRLDYVSEAQVANEVDRLRFSAP